MPSGAFAGDDARPPHGARDGYAYRLIDRLREEWPLSRPELARRLDVSAVTVATIAQRLVAAGVLVETGRGGRGVGRKAVLLDLVPRSGLALAVDVGFDSVGWRSVDLRGRQIGSGTFALPADPSGLVDLIAGLAGAELASSVAAATVVAVPAPVGGDGVVRHYGTPGMLHGVPLARRLQDALGTDRVAVENDLNLAAVGEHRLGAARGWSRFAFVGVRRTGIGMGLVLDGRLYRGANGRAGEIGNLRLRPGGTPLDATFTTISADALGELAQVLAVTFAVLDLEGVVLHSEVEAGNDWIAELESLLRVLVPYAIHTGRSLLGDDSVLAGASLVGLEAVVPALAGLASATRS